MTTQALELMIKWLVENQVKETDNKITEIKCVTCKNKITKYHVTKEL